MPVTRIKNNQITDASAGNIYLGVNAAAKLQDYSITSGKIANDLTYNSSLTITGNLTVQGNTTQIDTVNLIVEDPLILLAKEQTGSPALDIGYIGKRGTSENIAFVWDESSNAFATGFTTSETTNTTITITSYANLITNNLAADTVDVTGNITGANLDIGNGITAGTTIVATGNITGGNLTTAGITDTGSLTASTTIDATGNITGGNLTTAGITNTGSLTASTTIDATGNITGGNLTTAGITNTGSLTASTTIDATGNITGGNLITAGITSTGTLETTGNALIGGNLVVQGNITYINIDDLRVEDPIIILGTGPNGAPLTVDDGKDRGIYMEYYTTGLGNAYMGWQNSSGNIIIANDVEFSANDVVQVNAYGTLEVGNVYAQSADITGTLAVTGNIDGGNLNTGGQVVATGNITGGNLNTGGQAVVTGNITGGNLTTAGIANIGTLEVTGTSSLTGNVTSPLNVDGAITSATVTATGNIDGNNVIATTSGQFGNIVISGDDITDVGGGIVTFNVGAADVDFAVNGDTTPNIFYVDAGTGTASFGNATQTTNALVTFNSTNSILIPTGTNAERPATGVTGMLRFNTSLDQLEFYDADSWTSAGTTFTIVTADSFTGDGSTVAFTLSDDSTTAATIVSINGVVQIPVTAYSVSGNVLTFTEAPTVSDIIDARLLITTQTIKAIVNTSGNAAVEVTDSTNDVSITGDLVPVGNLSGNLGSPSLQWQDLYLAGNSIFLGDIVMKDVGGGQVGFFESDGTTPATLDPSNVDTTQIANGTAAVQAFANANVAISAGGTSNVAVFNSTGVTVANIFSTNGITCGGNVGLANGTSDMKVVEANGNIRFTVNGQRIFSVVPDGITNDQANGVGNIGNASFYFNTVFAKATSAQYADLAEMYEANQIIEPGTVVCFGGPKEIMVCDEDSCRRVAGVVSTNPSYIMNAGLEGEYVVAVALTGRVPTRVTGIVRKGDMLVAAGNGRARAEADPAVGQVIGKALADFDGQDGTIEVVVGRL